MKEQTYKKITDWIRKYPKGVQIVNLLDRVLTEVVYVAFFVLLFTMFFNKMYNEAIRMIVVCGVSFILVSVFRHFYNEKRPYAVYDFKPIVEKKKQGHSMPSRHVFSAFIIAMAFSYVDIPFSIIFFVIAVLMAVERVIAGVHYPKDVIVGAVIGVVLGYIGFYLIPYIKVF